ncbi:MFS transporter [Evansella sp. AB-rgal1]|uniref:MFS transporter n=1 Tax=Evansella sp. AB-rgal1 TaxID=3242696 RepID=UPI00359E5B82
MLKISLFFFVLFSSYAATGALMPLYLRYQGLSTEQIGVILALGAVVAVFGQPFFGYMSDKLQSTKKVLIGVMIISLCISIIYFQLSTFFMLLFIFIVLNFFKSSTGPLAWVSKEFIRFRFEPKQPLIETEVSLVVEV